MNGSARVRRGQGGSYWRVQPSVRPPGLAVVRDVVPVVVAAGLGVRDPVVVEVVRERVHDVGHAVPVLVGRGLRGDWGEVVPPRDPGPREESAGDLGEEEWLVRGG